MGATIGIFIAAAAAAAAAAASTFSAALLAAFSLGRCFFHSRPPLLQLFVAWVFVRGGHIGVQGNSRATSGQSNFILASPTFLTHASWKGPGRLHKSRGPHHVPVWGWGVLILSAGRRAWVPTESYKQEKGYMPHTSRPFFSARLESTYVHLVVARGFHHAGHVPTQHGDHGEVKNCVVVLQEVSLTREDAYHCSRDERTPSGAPCGGPAATLPLTSPDSLSP